MTLPHWPHQLYGFNETSAALDAGATRICVTSPTGSGKSVMMADLMTELAAPRLWNVTAYTNRKMLLEQWIKVLTAANIPFGVRASKHQTALLRPVQLCMVQSEWSAVYEKKVRVLHPSRLVIIDELHLNTSSTMQRIVNDHEAGGAQVVGYTATPLDLGPMATKLIVAAKMSDCRKCGAVVPFVTFGPDEPDLKKITRQPTGEYTDKDVRKLIMTSTIFGRVRDNLMILNPDLLPTLLFAPDVPGSIYFAEQLHASGIRAAHIGGSEIVLDGQQYENTTALRDRIVSEHRAGEIAVICTRFVLREGIDLPWVRHIVFATVFGGLQSYLQSGGRGGRAFEGKDRCVIQDHGGNWHRHGSLNADRHWSLGDTNYVLSEMREEALREHTEPDPIRCPKCGMIRLSGKECPSCKYMHKRGSRLVVELDGTLRKVEGYILRKKSRQKRENTEQRWKSCYYRCKKKGKTFRQAEGLFVSENGYYPPRDLPLMPVRKNFWFRPVDQVPTSELIG